MLCYFEGSIGRICNYWYFGNKFGLFLAFIATIYVLTMLFPKLSLTFADECCEGI